MSTTLNTRVQSKRDTSANWTQNNPVLLDGEVIVVDTNSGDVRFKVGNGTSTYTQLPFQDEYVLNQIPDVSNFVTAEDPTGIVNTVPPTFDGHTIDDFVLKTGTTMTGPLIAQSNINYSVGQVRNIFVSSSIPTNDIGNNGDIWMVYGGNN